MEQDRPATAVVGHSAHNCRPIMVDSGFLDLAPIDAFWENDDVRKGVTDFVGG